MWETFFTEGISEGPRLGSSAYLDDLTAWLEARVAGEPATDQCGA